MRKLMLTVIVLFAISGQTAHAHKLNEDRIAYSERLSHSVSHQIRALHLCQMNLNRSRTKSRGLYLRRGVKYRRWIFGIWYDRRVKCERDLRVLNAANTNWWLATTYANRVFPGSRGWLISCSASEGGHTSYVYNRQGSGAQGWLQFMTGTFYAHVAAAARETVSRGFVFLKSWNSIFSPAGHALTGAYMYSRGMTFHWVGAGC